MGFRAGLFLVFVVLAAGVGCQSGASKDEGTKLPAFVLTDQNGADFGSSDLEDEIWVANFFFSHCKTICPQVLGAMRVLMDHAEREGYPIRLVSITVDPDNDDPKTLKILAEKMKADPARWRFLTGSPEALRGLIVGGFKTLMGEREELANGIIDIGHGARLVLVGKDNRVRAHFEASEEGVAELLIRLKRELD
jgi:cytochrome oxidase Cu insertion factor (SCO1/SenC/PrrC family)